MPGLLIAVLAAPFLLALLAAVAAPWCARKPAAAGWILALPLALAAGAAAMAWHGGEVLMSEYSWVPALGTGFALAAGPLSWMLATLVLGIGAAVVAYGGTYLGPGKVAATFFPVVLLFAGAMTGIAFADDLVVLFVFWELTSITSFLLIGLHHEDAGNRAKATQALLVTGLGGLGLLTAAMLCGLATGTTRISVLLDSPGLLLAHPHAGWIAAGLLLAILSKSAQFPFHFWLPNAMAGPTPVSAYLHSATMVKAGVFLAAKLSPLFATLPGWRFTLLAAGSVTLVIALWRGFRGADLKAVLAASTLSVLAMLTMLVGMASALAASGFVLLFVAHALYKAPLFMVAGAIEHATGTKRIAELGGLGKSQPLPGAISLVALLSFAGLPPAAGFLGKEGFLEAVDHFHPAGLVVLVPALAVLFTLGLRVAWLPFRGPARGRVEHRCGPGLLVPPGLLALAGLLVPVVLVGGDFVPSTAAALGLPGDLPTVSYWHGWQPALFASIASLLGGWWLFRRAAPPESAPGLPPADRIYQMALDGLMVSAKALTRLVQNRKPAAHLMMVVATLFFILAIRLLDTGLTLPGFALQPGSLPLLLIGGLVGTAALVAATTSHPAVVVVSLGVVGLGISILFIWFSAPDLALTQILVETLVVILLVFALPWLSRSLSRSDRPAPGAALFATACGALAMLLVLKASVLPAVGEPVSAYHVEQSLPAAHGKNVVNVILVDFRALDTFGEITVLGIAALGLAELLRGFRNTPSTTARLLDPLRRLLTPLLVVIAAITLWRGHNHPGGGFIGALILSLTVGLLIISGGRQRLVPRWGRYLIVLGLGVAVLSGLVSIAAGRPWMTGVWLPAIEIPGFGTLLLGTPLLFDLGVMLTVMGFAFLSIYSFSGVPSPRTPTRS